MSKKFKVGIDLKCNIKNDCELFYLNDFKDYDFYNKLSARDAVRTKVYNVLAGKQNALNREEFGDDSFQLLPNGKVVAIGCGW